MRPLRYTLLADGGSDRTLIHVLNWLFDQSDIRYQDQFAQPLPQVGGDLEKRVLAAIRLFPCDLLFVHRDAETKTFDERVTEIQSQLATVKQPYVPIIPIRMTEAWLLSCEEAIRRAAGNPNGKMPLNLPTCEQWEKRPNPKEILFQALRVASGLSGRRLNSFSEHSARHRVAELTPDFSPLERLEAFRRLREQTEAFLVEWKEKTGS